MVKNNKLKGFYDRPFYDKLVVPIEIFERIRAFTLEAKGEISGFGRTTLADEGLTLSGSAIVVKEFDIFTQDCNPTHTTLKSADMTQMYIGVARAGGDPSQWNFWWHSHVDFNTGFSLEDDSTMKKITMPKNGQEGSMLVALCTNKFGDYDATVYQGGRRLMERIPLMIAPKLSPELLEQTKKLIKEKVSFQDYKVKFTPGKYYKDDFPVKTLHDNDDGFDIVVGRYAPLDNVSELILEKMSKNQRRKFERYNKTTSYQPFKRQEGWSPRP